MNIQQIYGEQKPLIEQKVADMYNSFAKYISQNEDYSLSDDEMGELFNELLLMYMHENMTSDYEFTRVFNSLVHKI